MTAAGSRRAGRCLLGLAAGALLLQLASQQAFVPGAPETAASVAAAAGSTALPAWATPEVLGTQLALARIPGGKFTKQKELMVEDPEDDYLSDGQIAVALIIALVALFCAIDLGKALNVGIQPIPKPGKKGYITPLVKRLIEKGY